MSKTPPKLPKKPPALEFDVEVDLPVPDLTEGLRHDLVTARASLQQLADDAEAARARAEVQEAKIMALEAQISQYKGVVIGLQDQLDDAHKLIGQVDVQLQQAKEGQLIDALADARAEVDQLKKQLRRHHGFKT